LSEVISGEVEDEAGTVPEQVADPSELFTIPEAARLLKVSTVYVRREIKAGELRTVRLGRSVRVARTDLDAYVEARREGR